ncbi:MAG: transcription antitermination factor NusB [Patescibacteria group bacterium]
MANRHLSRSLAMQSLFEWDFRGLADDSVSDIVKRQAEDFAPGLNDINFAVDLAVKTISKRKQLDDIITKAAPDWPLPQIAIVDRNILRIGLYELLFGDRFQVPARVAINEAIEIAKIFGGENSGRFVNGVLGAVYKELGEPDKHEIPKKQKTDISFEKMPVEHLAGAVVYTKTPAGALKLALVHDVFGYWTLSKGHIEKGETPADTVKREIKEEMSLDIEVVEILDSNEYIASDPEKGKVRKQVNYLLAKSVNLDQLSLGEAKGGLDDVGWFLIQDITDLKIYDDILPIIVAGLKKIKKIENKNE